jgi:hypothetical protein
MTDSNYNAKQPNNTAYIKNFVYGLPAILWKTMNYKKSDGTTSLVITPASSRIESLYIPGDLYVDGSILNPSDINLKQNIELLKVNITNKLMKLKPSSFEFKNDSSKHIHYGFIADEMEDEYPELIQCKPDIYYSKIKSVNYLEIIPLLVHKIQLMQEEIDELKKIKNIK